MTDFTTDDFLGGKVRLKQKINGYRATGDAVLLACAVDATPKQTVLDVGTGTGAVALCIAARCPQTQVAGIELQPEMAAMAEENIRLNGMQNRVTVLCQDVRTFPSSLPTGSFDWVVTNPPFILEDQVSPYALKDVAHRENDCSLKEWISSCLRYVGPKGRFVMINRADRLPEILSLLYGKLGGIRIVPVWTKEGRAAKRVLICGKKDSRSPCVLDPGIVLTRSDGTRSLKAEAVMREGESLFDKTGD